MFAIVEGELLNVAQRPMRGMRWRRMTTGFLRDCSGKGIRAVWFNLRGNGRMPAGEPLLVCGRVGMAGDGCPEMVHPEVYRLKDGPAPQIRPIYSLPGDVSQRLFAAIVAEAFNRLGADDIGSIPAEMRFAVNTPAVADALRYLHMPPADANPAELEESASTAHRALALVEMFTFQLALSRDRALGRRRPGAALNGDKRRLTAEFTATLPFKPTSAQSQRDRGNKRRACRFVADESPADGRRRERQDPGCISCGAARGGIGLAGRDDGADGTARGATPCQL